MTDVSDKLAVYMVVCPKTGQRSVVSLAGRVSRKQVLSFEATTNLDRDTVSKFVKNWDSSICFIGSAHLAIVLLC